MKRNGLIFITSLVLTLCAGIVLGAVWAKLPAAQVTASTQTPTTKPAGWLDDQLHLRPDQKSKMDLIWNDVRQKMSKSFETRRALEKERDDACKALLTEDQRAAWDKIRADYRAKIDESSGPNREALFRDAEKQTRDILDPDQQRTWDELKKQRDARHNQGGPRGMGNRSGSTQRSFGAPSGPRDRDHDGPPPPPQ